MNLKSLIPFLALFIFYTTYSQDSLNRPIPTEILFKKVKPYGFTISPDGKYFAEVLRNNAENDIIIVDIDAYKIHQRIPMGKTFVKRLRWLSSNRLLYESKGEILAINIDGTNATTIVSKLADKAKKEFWLRTYKDLRVNRVMSLLPKNKNEILIETFDYSGYASVKRVNIFTGQKRIVINGKFYKIDRWIADPKGNVRLGIRIDDDGGFEYYTFHPETTKLIPFNVVIDGKEIPLHIKANSYLTQNMSFEGFGYDPNIIYLTSNIGSDKRKLLTYNIA